MFSKVFLAACLLGSSVNAHMLIRSPVPYGQGSLNNSPLEPDGSDFPCKQRSGVYDITKMNNMEVGVPQELAFTGGASHGGGSCQVSVTMDKEPTKGSDWRVIHSIVGGCPTNETGNISGDPAYQGASVFQFSIPQGMPNGQYTLAWTWFNKIGNREMYMNCAPITVSGGADNHDAFDSLPAMFVANIPGNQCATIEGDDVVFPNPGSSVETAQSAKPGNPTGPNCGSAASSPGGSGSNSPSVPQVPSHESSPTTSSNSGGFQAIPTFYNLAKGDGDIVTATTLATVTASRHSPVIAEPTEAAETDQAPPAYSESPPAPQATGSEANDTTALSGCAAGLVQCSSPGSVLCIGSGQWGLCDIDYCAVPRELALGTSCSAGVISKRHVSRHVTRHLRRHVHHGSSF